MRIRIIHDKHTLYRFLKQEAGLQAYLIGDLDDFFWPKTIWYALEEEGCIKAVALLYCEVSPPTLLCFQNSEREYAIQLLREIKNFLPASFYAHLGEGFIDAFGSSNIIKHYGLNYKMVSQHKINSPGMDNIKRVDKKDLNNINAFYREAYPDNWFDLRMLESNRYLGFYVDGVLAGIAGIHVFSATYRVAALGNVATHPEYRNRGIAKKLIAALCYDLQNDVDTIGLNVRSDNKPAIRLYERLGFQVVGTYEECLLRNIGL